MAGCNQLSREGHLSKRLKIAMIAPPWLNMPPTGYGGIEYMVHYLTTELEELGHEVHLFTVGDTSTKAHRKNYIYPIGQFRHIQRPWYEALPIEAAHINMALNMVKTAGDFDVIHDHNFYIGPAMMANLDPKVFPPVLHTLHMPFSDDAKVEAGAPDNREMYAQLKYNKRLFFNGISYSQLKGAPPEITPRLVGAVHNAVDINDYPLETKKDDYFLTIARFCEEKGVGTAAKLCAEQGYKLKMAGLISTIASPHQLKEELTLTYSRYEEDQEFAYFKQHVAPYVSEDIEYIGAIYGRQKHEITGRAKALLWPITWEEPFGMAPIDVMATGTPVIAYRRGAVTEMIEHGVNGFIADTEDEFREYMHRVHEIKPEDCRAVVEERFSARVMARSYVEGYNRIIARSKQPSFSYTKWANQARRGLLQAGAFAESLADPLED